MMELAEIIIRIDREITAQETTHRSAQEAGRRTYSKVLGQQLDTLRTRRNELMDQLEREVGIDEALRQMGQARYEVAGH